jgi:hypothetical protein
MERSEDAEVVAIAESTVALLTPVIKAHFSDLGMSSTLSAQQIYGGHGYVREHGMEQLVRDCRIAPIYEGTNEIQALDLVARKVSGRMTDFANGFLGGLQQDLAKHRDNVGELFAPADAALQRLLDATAWIQEKAQSDEAAMRGAATQYLRLFGLTIVACLWVQMIATIKDKDGQFYDVKRKLARFYMEQVLPETASIAETIVGGAAALADFNVSDLTG